MKRAIAVSILSALLCACAVTPQEDLVQGLYQEDNALAPAAGFGAYFAQDLAAALDANAGGPGDVGTPDFDYRYAAQDVDVSRLRFHAAETNTGYARVVARFDNIGRPEDVVWNLCQRADGQWRIADAGNDGDIPWTLRNLLGAPADVTC